MDKGLQVKLTKNRYFKVGNTKITLLTIDSSKRVLLQTSSGATYWLSVLDKPLELLIRYENQVYSTIIDYTGIDYPYKSPRFSIRADRKLPIQRHI